MQFTALPKGGRRWVIFSAAFGPCVPRLTGGAFLSTDVLLKLLKPGGNL